MRRKIFIASLLAILATFACAPPSVAQARPVKVYDYGHVVTNFKKPVIIGTLKNYGPDSSAALQVGDTGSRYGFLPPVTDTGKVIRPALGLQIVNRSDSSCRYWDGRRWRKIGT